MSARERKSILIVGAERSGKSFFAAKLAKFMASMSWALIYNVVRETDFSGSSPIELLDAKEHASLLDSSQRKAYLKNPEISLFRKRDSKSVYHLKDFNKLSWNTVLKTGKLDYKIEEAFFQSCFDYMGLGLLVLDDARPIFRHGLKKKMIQLLSRKNHAGNKSSSEISHGQGIDVALVFHAIDKVNQEIYDYINTIVLFRTGRLPDKSKFNNEFLYSAISWSYNTLSNSPDYHSCHIDLRNTQNGINVIHFDRDLKKIQTKTF